MSRPTPARLAASLLATAALVTLAACGDDDDGGSGGSVEEFCDEFATLADADLEEGFDPDAFRSLADAAPDEISGAMTRFAEIVERVDSFDAADASDEDADEFMSMLNDLDASSTEIQSYLAENCPDLPPGLISNE